MSIFTGGLTCVLLHAPPAYCQDEGGPRVKLWDPRTWWGRGRQDPLADVGGRGFMGDQSDAQGLNPPAGAVSAHFEKLGCGAGQAGGQSVNQS
jgi:hypothetical protein